MKTQITLLITFASAFSFTLATAQFIVPEIEWQNTIGGRNIDDLYAVQQTSDGGYILGGYSYSGKSGDKTEASSGVFDYWVVKLNSAGVIEWQNTIGGTLDDILYSIQPTSDGGYILGGASASGISGDKTEASSGGKDYWVVKLNSTGTIEWQKTIGGSDYEYLYSIQQTSDGGYVLGGSSISGISGDKTEPSQGDYDYWVVKIDSSGSIEWQNTIGGSDYDFLYAVRQTSDGGYILGGLSYSGISGDKTEASLGIYYDDYWVVKLTSNGVIEWQNTIGGSNYDELYSIQQTTDGGYILGGVSYSGISGDKTEVALGNGDYWVVKLNRAGALEWQKTIGGIGTDILYSIQQASDDGYILGGYSDSDISGDKSEASSGGYDYWVLKLDNTGELKWQNTIGGNSDDYLHSIQQTSDRGYILGGTSKSSISGDKTEDLIGDKDYWVVKLASDENSCATPYGGYTTNITSGSATISWYDSTRTVSGYRIYYKVKNTSAWNKAHANGDSLSKILKGLSPNTTYSWMVGAKCDSAFHSDFSPHYEFTTLAEKENKIEDANFNWSLYPNPPEGRITLRANFETETNFELNILDVTGRKIFSKPEENVMGDFTKQFDLHNIPDGVYFFQINCKHQSNICKFLIKNN